MTRGETLNCHVDKEVVVPVDRWRFDHPMQPSRRIAVRQTPDCPSASQPHGGAAITNTADNISQEDLIEEIAYRLRPWKCSKSDVLAKIRGAIDELQSEFTTASPWRGFYSENKEYASNILDAI